MMYERGTNPRILYQHKCNINTQYWNYEVTCIKDSVFGILQIDDNYFYMDKDFNFSPLVRRIVGIGNLNGDLYLALDD